MKLVNDNTARWIGGMCVGAVLTETLKAGKGAVVLLFATLLGRWIVGQLANTMFGDEFADLKKRFASKDPIKQSIWGHTHAGHSGKWRDCREPECSLAGEVIR